MEAAGVVGDRGGSATDEVDSDSATAATAISDDEQSAVTSELPSKLLLKLDLFTVVFVFCPVYSLQGKFLMRIQSTWV